MVKLSILIPYYNTYNLTIKLLKELSIQKTDEIEIILIDDGCNEKEFDKYNEFKVIHLEKNVGMSNALNIGLDIVEGEYIGFIDSDDMITMDYIDILLDVLKEHNEDIIYFNWADFNNNYIVTHPVNCALWKAIYKRNIFPRFEKDRRHNNDVPVQEQLKSKKHSEYYIDRVLYIYNSNREDSLTWKAEKLRRKKMVKLETIKNFTLANFDVLKNVERKGEDIYGYLKVGDTFECDEEMAEYLTGNNPKKEVVVKILEVEPKKEENEEQPTEIEQEIVEEQENEVQEEVVEVEEAPIVEEIEVKKKENKKKSKK